MTKLTMFINAYKLGSVSHLLDAPVFAEFKAHLNDQAKATVQDGESDGEWEDVDEASSRGALDEIENDLNEDSGEGSAHSLGSSSSGEGSDNGYESDGECEED